MKRLTLLFTAALLTAGTIYAEGLPDGSTSLANDRVAVAVGPDGSLVSLKNIQTGQEYAGGGLLWRLYYDAPYEKEIQVLGSEQHPEIDTDGNVITLRYNSLEAHGRSLDVKLTLTITLEEDMVRFGSAMENHQEHTVIRELHYPLVHAAQIPGDHKLYTSEAGGMLFDNPLETINRLTSSPYKKPEQIFRQRDVKSGAKVFMNCFGLFGNNQGLYFGSHDDTFQDTWHGLRVYKDSDGAYSRLEFGFFKYPHCFCGESWSCDANVIAPYSGSWHVASGIYRRWVNTWWDHRETPLWVRKMKSWQRVIFKHQYGEYFFRYPDINGKVNEAGQSVGCNAIFLFGWWAEGMDHGNPDYSPDDSQGGDAALKAEIARYQDAGNHLLLYYNGKLIDRESRFYRSGMGSRVCRHDNTGSEILERYKFTGQGTWLGEYDQRTFAVATMMDPEWNQVLFKLQDRAYELGAHSVFFDQLGYVEKESTNWDTSREYPVPDVFGIRKRMECLKLLRDRYADKAPDFALGAEGSVDALAQYCDYTHGYPANDGPERWISFFRYTFPELVFTDRGLRDDEDVPRHINNTVLDGQRNDIEIFRCRGIISDAPVCQAYLAQANAIKEKYQDCLLLGRYNDVFGFTCTNRMLDARSFLSEDGRRMAVVVANQQMKKARRLRGRIKAPGYRFVEASVTGSGKVSGKGGRVKLGQYDMAVLLFEKNREDMRIGTYNLRRAKLDKNSPENNWDKRAPRLIQSFLDNDFDICGVQEVDAEEQVSIPRMLEEKGLEYSCHFFNPYADDGVGSKAHGLLWKKDRFTLVGEPHHFWISNPPELRQKNDTVPSLKKNFIRGGFCLTLEEKGGKKLFVMVTHAPLNKEQHARYAGIFLEMEKKYNPEGYPSFFLGDFNASELDECSAVYRSYWTDAYHAFDGNPAARKGPLGSFNAWRMTSPPAKRRIDFVYFRGKGVTPVAYVCNNKLYDGGYPSDHFPIFADFITE